MGGGDLNLKKSWHPSTLRNIERVWKAEQKHEVEKQKIEQLQKELAEERAREEIQAYAEDQGVVKKREERLDWMYQGPTAMINREDYLLGRKVDKTLEILEREENGATGMKNEDDNIGSMFSSQDLTGTATVDLANKIREDPLFSIMKKEKEQRKNLLSNPVKMKQLQMMLQESLGKEKKKSKKRNSEYDSDSDERRKHHKKHKKKDKKNYSSDEEKTDKKKHQNNSKKKVLEDDKYYRKSLSSRSYQNTYYKDVDKGRNDHYSSKHVNNHSRETYRKAQPNKDKHFDSGNKRQIMDAEDKERRLKEMQENAVWRESQRQRRVMRCREDDEREEKDRTMDASTFIKPMLSKAATKGSLVNRVKQKAFSIQRNAADMDKNFVRR